MSASRLYLVRHGLAEGAAGRAVGHVDLPLSAGGREAAERLAATWVGRPPERLVASPLARAAATAAVLADAWGLPPATPEPRLAEMSFGAWDGRRWDELHAAEGERLAAWAARWWEDPTPEGEGFADLVRRVGEWWDELWGGAGSPPPGATVAVTHAGPIRALLAGRLGVPREEVWEVAIGEARVTAVEAAAGGAPRLVFVDRPGFAEEAPATAPAPA
ncbi:MAG TPA: histidine phosphatase family protein [Thermoanaerobaculia bacterium]